MQRAEPRKDHPDYGDKACFIGKVLGKYSGKGWRCFGNLFLQTKHNIWVDSQQPRLLYQLGTKLV